jgi:hypothetical protein
MVGVCEMQEANDVVGQQPERGTGRFAQLVDNKPTFGCKVGIYSQHDYRRGEGFCWICGRRFHADAPRPDRRPLRGPALLDVRLEYDDGDYHDWPDQLADLEMYGDHYGVKPSALYVWEEFIEEKYKEV